MLTYPRFDNAPCTANPDLFFPIATHPLSGEAQRAKQICGRCRYREPCAEWALAHREAGIWGGTSDQDRSNLRRRRTAESRQTSRYVLYETTQRMIVEDRLTVRECAERLGLTYEHVTSTRRRVRREIEAGAWSP
jgi:WhiB family redox-sensing transcriptional regulator